MKRQRTILTLIVIPAIVSLLVSLLVLYIWESRQLPDQQVLVLPTNSSTSQPDAVNSGDSAEESESPGEAAADDPSEDVPTEEPTQETVITEDGCENPVHTVAAGEVLGRIATDYSVTVDELIAINQQVNPDFSADFISVGQKLVIPSCGIPTLTPTVPATITPTPTRIIPTPIATNTPSPGGEIQVVIARVISPGDITREAVDVVNLGATVDLEGWVLTKDGGEEYEFPGVRLFTDGLVTVYTGVGENTASELYWGLDAAAWESGDIIQLWGADGKLQAEFEVTE